jgi:hypothetical protein
LLRYCIRKFSWKIFIRKFEKIFETALVFIHPSHRCNTLNFLLLNMPVIGFQSVVLWGIARFFVQIKVKSSEISKI